MDVDRLIRRLNGRQDAVENGRVAAVVTAELFAECAAALAKLQAERDEALGVVRMVARCEHTGDDGYVYPDFHDDDDSRETLDGLIAKAREIPASRALGGGE